MRIEIKIITVIFIAILLQACVTGKNTITHDFPPNMPPHVKEGYIKMWESGKALYGINCAKCHNTKVRGREVVPDFSEAKLIGYELRVLNPKHEANIPETTVTTEELGLIMTFLRYKKKQPASR